MNLKNKKIQPTLLGERVFTFRKEENLTQKEMAELCSLSSDFISRIERGFIKKPRQATIKKLSDIMGTTPKKLTGPSKAKLKEVKISTEPGCWPNEYTPATTEGKIDYAKRMAVEHFKRTMTVKDCPDRIVQEIERGCLDSVIRTISKLAHKFYSLEITDREDVIGFIDYKRGRYNGKGEA